MDIVLCLSLTLRKHTIDLLPGANLSNLLRYRVNPTEHAELKRQVNLKLSGAEVAYNTSVNGTINKSPHNESGHDFRSKQPTDFIPYLITIEFLSLHHHLHHLLHHKHELHKKNGVRLLKIMPTKSYKLMLGTD